MADGQKDIFLSCFKCGRIVRAGDSECPRCGLQFGPGTLFECPFCSGLVWRNASRCSTCGIDLTEFSLGVEKTFAGFDMDEFVENIINTELEQLKSTTRRVGCPGCGLMIRGDEEKCPRCDLPLGEVSVICPVCGEKMQIDAKSCPNCRADFAYAEEPSMPEQPPSEATQEDATVSVEVAAGESSTEPVKGRKQEPSDAKRPSKRKTPSRSKPASKKPPSKKRSSPKKPAGKKPSTPSKKGGPRKKSPSSGKAKRKK